jgi:hypothetical protein
MGLFISRRLTIVLFSLVISTPALSSTILLIPVAGGTLKDGAIGPYDGTPEQFVSGTTGNATSSASIETQFFAEFDIQAFTTINSATLIYDLRYNVSPGSATSDIYSYDASLLSSPSTLSTADDRWDDFHEGETYFATTPIQSMGVSTYSIDVTSLLTSSQSIVGFRFQDVNLISGISAQVFIDQIQLEVTGVVPVPAAVWLFGSGLLGLVGVAKRKKS